MQCNILTGSGVRVWTGLGGGGGGQGHYSAYHPQLPHL